MYYVPTGPTAQAECWRVSGEVTRAGFQGAGPPVPHWPDKAAEQITQGPSQISQGLVTWAKAAPAAGPSCGHCLLVPSPGATLGSETQLVLFSNVLAILMHFCFQSVYHLTQQFHI